MLFTGGKPGLLAAKGVVAVHFQANKLQSGLDAEPNVVYVSITNFEEYYIRP